MIERAKKWVSQKLKSQIGASTTVHYVNVVAWLFGLMTQPLKRGNVRSIKGNEAGFSILRYSYRNKSKGSIRHNVIDSTGLKVFGKVNGKFKSTAMKNAEHGASCILLSM